jgi:hypothetical protein
MKYPETTFEVLKIIAQTDFRPFHKAEWDTFNGCESKNPIIGEHDTMLVIIDADKVMLLDENDEYGGKLYFMNFSS